ncbi:MAG: YgaP family membrane protein [Bacteroidales bacterium]
MKKNVGKTDRAIRILLGVIITAAGLYFQSWWGLLAIVPFATAFAGSCPLYSILGLSSCPAKATS